VIADIESKNDYSTTLHGDLVLVPRRKANDIRYVLRIARNGYRNRSRCDA
jgi:hypothetical protein